MATTNQTQPPTFYIWDDADDSDLDSLASIDTDDGEAHAPEKIIAEVEGQRGQSWYLVKWENCSLLRSSWEGEDVFLRRPATLERDWEAEKKRQRNGESKPLDIGVFNKAVLELEDAERQRRRLRRLKSKVKRVLSIVSG